ncbi:hypothetical protein [Absidia glauca]|uniref:Thioredoxin domain-containing protein n=1 Tax=Absidia glauca TaxID=4829 RepID=A0A168NR25_ABSGL|nr:hypothetical protein [Absidia glauca]
MNSLRISAKALPLRSLTARSFHTTQPWMKTVEISGKEFEKAVLQAEHPVFVDFYAEWCGPCKMLAPVLSKAVDAHPELTLYKVNVDDNMEISQKYNIASLPTVTAFHNGKVVDQFVGMINKAQIQTFVDAHAKRAD